MFIKNIVTRLLQYRSSIAHLKEIGFKKIFSSYLAQEVGISAEQIRKDFSLFNIKGNKKGGYDIDILLDSLNNILKKNQQENIIIIGMGNIGKALAQYRGFMSENIAVVAAFDLDPSKQNKILGVPVYPLDKTSDIINSNNVKIAIICVPAKVAQEICDTLIQRNIKGILNFAPVVLKVPEDIYVYNINLTNEINNMIFFINNNY